MLRQWSFAKVALVSTAWVVVCFVVIAAWPLIAIWTAYSQFEGSGGIGAVSFGINALTLAIPIVPPILLFVAWLAARRR